MKKGKPLILLAVVIVLFTFFVPVIRFDTNVSPLCVREKIPCPLLIHAPLASAVYWSITAYYIGIGTYYAVGVGFGFGLALALQVFR